MSEGIGISVNGGIPNPQISLGNAVNTKKKSFSQAFKSPKDVLAEQQKFRILLFGGAGTGKTHFGLSMPEPVCVLDSEDRAGLILGKFSNENGHQKEIYVSQWRDMDELIENTNLAIEFLEERFMETGQRGTILVDSLSEAWIAAQQKFADEKFGKGVDLKDIQFDPMTDYKHINAIHNKQWRDKILDANVNCCFTAMETSEYGDNRFKAIGVKPEGQKKNAYVVDYFVFNYLDSEDNQISMIRKSSLLQNAKIADSYKEIRDLDFAKFERGIDRMKERAGIRTIDQLMKEIEEDMVKEGVSNE